MSNSPDIYRFEKRFQKIIYEAQRNQTELDKLEKEHLLIREQLYSKESVLQIERRSSQDLRARLKLAMETIKRLEEEKMRDKIDYSNLLINYDSVVRERDILAEELLSSRVDAAKFKIKSETLEKTLQRKEELEKTLIELKNDNEKIIANIDVNIGKISKEQKYLLENGKAVICLNKRLQTLGLCFHAINEKNRAEIKDLRHKLIGFSVNESKSLSVDKLHPEMESLCLKLKELFLELKSKMEDSTLMEENINKIFQELISIYNSQYSVIN